MIQYEDVPQKIEYEEIEGEDRPFIICPYCGGKATWGSNARIYGRPYGKSYMCYLCPKCDAYVGCSQNSTRPLGTLANKALRKLRIQTHHTIDALWKSGKITRRRLYVRLQEIFGYEVHVGSADEELCREIIRRVGEI